MNRLREKYIKEVVPSLTVASPTPILTTIFSSLGTNIGVE